MASTGARRAATRPATARARAATITSPRWAMEKAMTRSIMEGCDRSSFLGDLAQVLARVAAQLGLARLAAQEDDAAFDGHAHGRAHGPEGLAGDGADLLSGDAGGVVGGGGLARRGGGAAGGPEVAGGDGGVEPRLGGEQEGARGDHPPAGL